MPTPMLPYAVLRVSGADATAFLHAQLTTDINHLEPSQHALAAWCDAKGRALCTCRIVPEDGSYLLLLPASLADSIQRRLRMYVLRAQVEIADVSGQWRIGGVIDNTWQTTPADGRLDRRAGTLLLGINTGAGPGTLMMSSTDSSDTALPITDNAWQLAEIDAGLPEITAATSGLFVPQMLNLHWVGGIEFDKGCYPGQEIIARLQYRGQLKRRMFRMQWRGEQPRPGHEVFDAAGDKQGMVIRAAHCDDNTGRLLAVIRVEASGQLLTVGDARLEVLDLPYVTGDD